MEIVLTAVEKGGDYPISHDLNFQSTRYESKHTIVSSHRSQRGDTADYNALPQT